MEGFRASIQPGQADNLGPSHAEKHSTHRQEDQAQDGGEGQTVSLCHLPEAQPEAREKTGAVVLPEVSGRKRRGIPVKILYLHGWNSVVGGVKPTSVKSRGHEVIEPALDHEDFQAALRTAKAAFDQHQPEVVVGSSRGGAVAMNVDSGSARLVLICPAWKK